MNEQYTADLFSEQLDRVLLGQDPALASEFSDLQELLTLGEQISQVNFQPNEAMQQTFQSQLATWFGSAPNGAATLLGLSKVWLLIIGAAVVVIGTALGFARLPGTLFDSPGSDANSLPVIEAEGSPTTAPFGTTEAIGLPGPVEPAETAPSASATSTKTPAEEKSSQGDVIRPTTSSLGDTLPTALPSLEETLPLPTAVPTATQEVDITAGEGETAGGDNGDEDSSASPDSSKGDEDDRGHGNEPDGFDEDNPGESEGVPDPSGGAPGQDKSSQGLNPSDFSRGEGGGGGQGNAGGQGTGRGQGRGRGGGQGQGKGRGNQ